MKKEGWKYKKLGEVCEIFGRIGFRGYTKADFVTHPKDGAITLSPSNIINGELDFSKCSYINWQKYHESPEIMLEVGDVVLVKTASIGKCALVRELPHETTLNPQFVVLKKLQINGAFFVYFLKSPKCQQIIQQFSAGAAIPTLSQKKLGTLAVPVPPLKEQEEIVAYLDGEFERIEKLKRNAEAALQHTKDLFQSTLKQLLTPKPNWEEKELEKTCSHIVDCPHTTPVKSITKTIYPCIRTSELKGGEIFWDSMQYVEEDEYKKRVTRLIPQENDIVYGREGTFGDAVLLPKGYNFCLGQRTMLLRANTNMISPCFLLYQIISPFVYNQACEKNVGCGVPHVNVADVKKFKISFPPLAEQQAIVSRLDTLSEHCRKLEQNYRDTLTLCDDLKQALLREVFE